MTKEPEQKTKQEIPTLSERLKNYAKSTFVWLGNGMPIRTKARVEELYEICKKCPTGKFSQRMDKNRGGCSACGCPVNNKSGLVNINNNKLARATESCPDEHFPDDTKQSE